jgi:hypothetical protein
MSKIKTLTSSLTAIALVGGIGFAYAQATNTEPSTAPSTTQQMPSSTTPAEAPSTTTPSTTPNAAPGADSTTTPSSSSQPMASEPAPQADRN